MQKPKNICIYIPDKGASPTLDVLVQALQKVHIPIEVTSPRAEDHYACILLLSQPAHEDWAREALTRLHIWGCRSILVWDGHKPLVKPAQWQWLSNGARDIVQWRNDEEAASRVVAHLLRWQQVERRLSDEFVKECLIGDSPAWRNTLRNLIEVAVFSQAPVLIMGESGTGKEMSARLIHHFDIRPWKANLTLLDCSAISPELSGSEFFGHEKGAFTGAINAREGAFAQADKGTLFLDEVGELPLGLQAELLRAVQEGTYKRVGGNQWRRADFRLVSATNRNLTQLVAERLFRADFFYRMSTWVIRLPPLRERTEDIPTLVNAFLKQVMLPGRTCPGVDPLLMDYLCARPYPGNVRELRQVVLRMAARYTGAGRLSIGDLAEADRPNATEVQAGLERIPDLVQWLRWGMQQGRGLKAMTADFSNLAKDLAIEDSNGNLQAASEMLGVTDRTLQIYCAGKSTPMVLTGGASFCHTLRQ